MTDRYAALDAYGAGVSYSMEKNVSLSGYSSFRIGGLCDRAAWPDSVDSLCELIGFLRGQSLRYTVIGNGSNMLFDDAGYRGVIVFTTRMRRITREGKRVCAECGASMASLTRYAMQNGLGGLEFAYGIPGSCGGAVVMNAGAYGGEIAQVLSEALILDPESGKSYVLQNADMQFGYRHSIFDGCDHILLSATFDLQNRDPKVIMDTMQELMQRRIDRQPLDMPSAGSVFKRCQGRYIGQMVEQAGLKGYRVGGAEVSTKHAGFIVNVGGATSADVLALICHIKDVIKAQFDVELECEVRHLSPS